MEQLSGDTASNKPPKRRTWKIIALVAAAGSVTYGIAPLTFWGFTHDPNWADFWETAATPYGTMTAGYAAITAAGIALANGREQRKQDRDNADRQHRHDQTQLETTRIADDRQHAAAIVRDLRSRFTTATKQLADTTATIQQAGAYALASLADDWIEQNNPQETQVCIDVLCTYLRTHHHTAAQQQHLPHGENYDYTQEPPDQPVRDTITRIINNHTQKGDQPGPWSSHDYDLTGAHLHNLKLNKSHISGDIGLEGAHLTGKNISFRGARFSGEHTSFRSARFSGENISFDEAQFTGKNTVFVEARFTGKNTWFDKAPFSGEFTSFDGAHFAGERTSFASAKFTGVFTSFNGAYFTGENTGFFGARFTGENIWFDGAHFASKKTWFANTHFTGETTGFAGAEFTGEKIGFVGTQFAGQNDFTNATFGDLSIVSFHRATVDADCTIEVDWADDRDSQPESVTPRPWPPNLGAAATPSTPEPA